MLSVVILIFNTGKYLDKCLASVVNQTYKDLEIILVNDCSTDQKTNRVIHQWLEKDTRIELIDKKVNEGVDKARISGIYASHGEYLTFVDSDDWLPLDAFESLMDKVCDTGADIVKGNMSSMWLGGVLKKNATLEPSLVGRIILQNELMDRYYLSYFGVNIISVALWGTVFNRSLFFDANIQPSGLRFGEDLVMNMKIFPHVKKFYQLEKVVYYYRQGLPTMSDKYLDKWLPNFNSLYKIKMQQIKDTRYEKAVIYQKVELINYLRSFVIGCNRHRKDRISECIAELQQELSDPIYRNLAEFMKKEKWKNMAEMLEQGDASRFWNYVTEQQVRGMTFKMKVMDSLFSILSVIQK